MPFHRQGGRTLVAHDIRSHEIGAPPMPETAVSESAAGVPLRELARRHGLSTAGARPSVPAYLRQLWAYRHFIHTYADARVSSSLSKTRLGRLWQVFTPLTNAAVYYLIFGVILNTR